MIFTELRFLLFFAVVLGVHWSLRKNTSRKLWLLVCSYAFYAAWDVRFLSLIVGSTLLDGLVGRAIHRSEDEKRRNRLLALSVSLNLGLLGVFKYLGFFVDSGVSFLHWLGLDVSAPTLAIVLPVGISFYTFQTMSYSLDIHARRLKPARSALDLALFVGFFPQLVAGPIVRARAFLPQLASRRNFQAIDVRACLMLFLIGFLKKAVISDSLSPSVDIYFARPELFDAASTWLALGLYSVQIYCDFSGYSDMAIACAGLLGYNLCLNFDFPYFATNIASFWRRWHISLSNWLRDYLFIPLSETKLLSRTPMLALMLTMLLGGLWHGAAWKFVFWGGLHGLALLVHRLWVLHSPARLRQSKTMALAGTLLTLWWLGLTWVFFRSETLSSALHIAASYLSLSPPGPVLGSGATLLAADMPAWFGDPLASGAAAQTVSLGDRMPWVLALLFVLHWISWRKWCAGWWRRLPEWGFALFVGGAAAITAALMQPEAEAFIYFQF